MNNRYCKFCAVEHSLTSEFWYRLNASPRCKTQMKQDRKDRYDPIKQAQYNKEYRALNGTYLANKHKEWREANKLQHRAAARDWYYNNKDRAKATQQLYKKNRSKIDPAFKLACNLRTRMYRVLLGKHKVGSAIKDLGCTTTELKVHLENQFETGMFWSNYGTHWEVDHILPLANYQLTDRGTYRRLAHYTNLQPMWIVHNRSKSNKEVFTMSA